MNRASTCYLAMALLGAWACGACEELPAPLTPAASTKPPPEDYFVVTPPDPSLTGLTVLVWPEPYVAMSETAQKHVGMWPHELVSSLDRRLVENGFSVVHDANLPHDIDLRLEATISGHDDFYFFRRARMAVEYDGRLIADVERQAGSEDLGARHPDRVAVRLVSAFGASRQVVALMNKVRGPALATPAPAPAVAPAPALPVAAAPSAPAARPGAASKFVTAAPQPGAYAFVVGIESYRDAPAASGARYDAEQFAELVRKTLGLRENHVRVALESRATRSDIVHGLTWLRDSVPAGGRAYFFFSGHGAPTADSSTYLLPYDGNPQDVSGTAVAMSEVMATLGNSRGRDVLAIVDACFSGAGGRSVLPAGARPLLRVREVAPATRVALFTASRGDEMSGPAPGEAAGLFSKTLLNALGSGAADVNGDGQVSLRELNDWVTPRVARDAKNDKRDQHPTLVVGSGISNPDDFIVEYGLATQ